jgi:uncharacterized RDD family membrane protein YckC
VTLTVKLTRQQPGTVNQVHAPSHRLLDPLLAFVIISVVLVILTVPMVSRSFLTFLTLPEPS